MNNYDYLDDGSLTAAYGRYLRACQDNFIMYNKLKDDILNSIKPVIEKEIDIQIKNEASPAIKELKIDLQNLFK